MTNHRGLRPHAARRTPPILVAGLVAGALLVAGLAGAADPPDPRAEGMPSGDRLGALIERMRLEQEQIQTLAADFVQKKESEMLLEPEEARGQFTYAAPDRVRWEYATPNPISMVIAGGRMTTWYRDLEQAERIDIGRQSQRILEYLGAGSSLDTLIEYFDVRLHMPKDPLLPLELELDPRFERVAKRLQGMSLWVHPELFLPVRVRYVEADGDVTDYEFSNFRINGQVPDDQFRLEIPDTVDVRTIDLNRRGALR